MTAAALFHYPDQAAFDRVVPKSKIYAYARPSRRVRECFVKEVDQIVWKYKLSPETVNLPARPGVPEIQVFGVQLRVDAISEAVLRTIDKAISFPILYELYYGQRVKSAAAYKRPSDADASKWVVDHYFETPWYPADVAREAFPLALDLSALYEQVMRRHLPLPARRGESLKAQVERASAIRAKQVEYRKLEVRLRQEQQFNRKVELNRALRAVKNELDSLAGC